MPRLLTLIAVLTVAAPLALAPGVANAQADPRAVFESLREAYERGENEAVRRQLLPFTGRTDVWGATAHQYLGEIALAQADTVLAARHVAQSVRLYQKNLDQAVGVFGGTRDEWEGGVREFFDTATELAAHLFGKGRYSDARFVYQELVPAFPFHSSMLFNLANSLYGLEDWGAAEPVAARASMLNPLDVNLRLIRAHALRGLGRLQEAVAVLEEIDRLPVQVTEWSYDDDYGKFDASIAAGAAAAGTPIALDLTTRGMNGQASHRERIVVLAPAKGDTTWVSSRAAHGKRESFTFSYTYEPRSALGPAAPGGDPATSSDGLQLARASRATTYSPSGSARR